MRLSKDMEAVEGVTLAAAMMGTPQNLALMRQAGLLAADGESAGPADLVIAVVATHARAADGAREAAEAALRTPRGANEAGGDVRRPRTLGAALTMLPGANLALISVPGMYAGAEALKALRDAALADAGLGALGAAPQAIVGWYGLSLSMARGENGASR